MSTPTWFTDAIATPYDAAEVTVDGAQIRYRAWGKPGRQAVVLVHGGAANAAWWDHIAPFLAAEHRVVAIDLSGHGDSDRRADYSLDTWADEVLAVAATRVRRPAGHRRPQHGRVRRRSPPPSHTARSCAASPPSTHRCARCRPRRETWLAKQLRRCRRTRCAPDRETVLARFSTLPEDEAGLEYVRRHVAEQSVREVEGGWSWKFDPQIFLSSQMEPEDLAEAGCEVALVRGERGMATTDITESVAEILGGHVPVTLVPDAGHHIMFDQPIALIALLQTLIGQWRMP